MSEDPVPPIRVVANRRTVLPRHRPAVGHPTGDEPVVAVATPPAPAGPVGWEASPPTGSARTPLYHILVRAVFCADSDGTHAATATGAEVSSMLAVVSSIYAGAGLTFTLAESETMADSMLNQDVTVPADADLTNPDPPMPDAEWNASFVQHNLARDAYARQHRGRLVVFFRYGTLLKWNAAAKTWYADAAGRAFSGSDQEFVAMGPGDTSALRFAHESGHYFHLNHTFNLLVTLTEDETALHPDWQHSQADRDGGAAILKARLAEGIRHYVDDLGHPADQGLQVLNGDGLADTPPDPAPPIFRYVYGDQCAPGPVSVNVALAAGVRAYTVSAPLDLSMSYFYACAGAKRFSPLQIDIIRRSLETKTFTTTVPNEVGEQVPVLSRHHLIAPGPGTVGDPSTSHLAKPPQTRPPDPPPSPYRTGGWITRLRRLIGRR